MAGNELCSKFVAVCGFVVKRKVKVMSSMARSSTKDNPTTTVCGINYQLLIMLLKWQNGQLLVPLDHSHAFMDNGVRDC